MANPRSHRTRIDLAATPQANVLPLAQYAPVAVLQDCPLTVLKEAMQALSDADTFDDVKRIHDHAEALRIYARSAALGLEVQNRAAELRLRAERKAGEQLRDSGMQGGDRRSRSHDATLKLADLGVTKQQAHRWRRIAEVPAPDFELYFRRCGDQQEEITGAGLLRTTSGDRNGKGSALDAKRSKLVGKLCEQLEELIQARKQFQCIYAMPPWSEGLAAGRIGPLGLLDFSELQRMPVKEVAADNAHLHLFTPNEYLPHAIKLLEGWGFRYANALVIRSSQPAYGPFWRDAAAFLVLGIRGAPSFGDNDIPGYIKTLPTNLTSLHDLVERVSPPPYLLLFGPKSYKRGQWMGVNG